MWGAWTLIGLVQIYTNRYMKHFWKVRHYIHSVTGFLIFAITVVSGLLTIRKLGWTIASTRHTIAGFVTLILAVLLCLGGVFSLVMLKTKTSEWD